MDFFSHEQYIYIRHESFCQVNSLSANYMQPQSGLSEIDKLISILQQSQIPANLKERAMQQIERIALTLKFGGNLTQLDVTEKYIDWITNLPWFNSSQDLLDIRRAKELLDKKHYGLDRVKTRVLEYISMLILQKQNLKLEAYRAPILFFVGLAGTGKTTFAVSLAEAFGREFIRIPFGGLGSAFDLRGQPKTTPAAEPGMIIKALRKANTKNPVILLDELDRVSSDARSSIMGVLIEVLDPGQNVAFTDYFIDFPFDLSQVLFVATANNTKDIATAVLDRLEVIQMPSYNDDEKIYIGKNYVFPKYVQDLGLTSQQIGIDDAVWPKLVRPLGFEPGIRSLERMIEGIVRKSAYKLVSGQVPSVYVNENNMKEYIA